MLSRDLPSSIVLAAAFGMWLSLYSGETAFAQNSTPATSTTPKPPIAIDLSAAQVQNWPVDQGTYRIVLYNAIPGIRYVVRSGTAETAEVAAIVFPAGSTVAGPLIAGTPAAGCLAALDKARLLFKETNESNVPRIQQDIRADLIGCTDTTHLEYIRSVLAQTVFESGLEIQMPNDARRTVTVAKGTKEWNVTLTTLLRGRIQTLYGWAFAPDRDQDYFSEAGANNTFTVRLKEKNDKWGLTNLPSVFFTWLPTSQAFKDIQHGPTFGLGVAVGDAARPSFLGGWMVRWNQNLGIVFGAAIYPHHRLDPTYKVDQVISMNLDSLKLNKNEVRINAFFGGVFRFGSDPRKAPAPATTGK